MNKAYSNTTATVGFPYEYYPTPTVGEVVSGLNRKGEVVCEATVVKVMNPARFDHTPIVTVEIPKELADEVRNMKRV